MISKALIQEAILAAMSTGADFAEVFYEHTENHSINMLDDHVRNIDDGTICGVGIRAYSGFRATYGSTSDLSYDSVIRCAKSVAWALMEGKASINPKNLEERIFPNIHPIKVVPSTAGLKKKIDILKSGYDSAKNRDSKIIQVTGTLLDVDRNIVVANSEGLYTSDRQIRTRMMIRSVASANGENQTGGCAPGRSMGLELFEDVVDPVEVGRHASDVALENLKGTYCKAGTYTVAIENGFGGVIFHESCGHSLEASSVAFGASEFCGKIGQVIANPKVTAIDDGTIPNAWGSVNIDDEGIPTQKKILIEKGVLKRYMVDRLNGRRMNMASSGSSRRQNYSFEPTSRMTNTYIAAGEDEDKDIIGSIENGIYAKEMGGGSVNPVTGAFNFSVSLGYMVRNGKICEPVRGASLIGTGSGILKDIDMVGKHMATGQGMCGSSSGSVPTDVGQPLIRVSKITVGGR